jgi:hypothetical protein
MQTPAPDEVFYFSVNVSPPSPTCQSDVGSFFVPHVQFAGAAGRHQTPGRLFLTNEMLVSPQAQS